MLPSIKQALLTTCILILSCGITTSASTSEAELVIWEKVKVYDGITIYLQKKPGGLTRFKGVGRVQVNDLYSLVAIMEDYAHIHKWLAMVTEMKELHRDDYYNRYMYGLVKLPALLTRDFVVKTSVSQDPENQSLVMHISNEYGYIPHSHQYLRFKHFDGLLKFDIISKTEVNMTYEIEIDTPDNITSNILDHFTIFTPYLTIKNIREVLKNPKYHNLETSHAEIQFTQWKKPKH